MKLGHQKMRRGCEEEDKRGEKEIERRYQED